MKPRIHFAHLPTKIEALPRLSAALQGPRLVVKRDDQTGLAFGGNKTRKLEYLLAHWSYSAIRLSRPTATTCCIIYLGRRWSSPKGKMWKTNSEKSSKMHCLKAENLT